MTAPVDPTPALAVLCVLLARLGPVAVTRAEMEAIRGLNLAVTIRHDGIQACLMMPEAVGSA